METVHTYKPSDYIHTLPHSFTQDRGQKEKRPCQRGPFKCWHQLWNQLGSGQCEGCVHNPTTSLYMRHGQSRPCSFLTHLTRPPLCTSISGALRAAVWLPSSQVEWLQTGRTVPSAQVVLLLLTAEDVSILSADLGFLVLFTACFSTQSDVCFIYMMNYNMQTHTPTHAG